MARVALPRIGSVLEERRDRIASDLDRAEQLKKKTEETIAAYEQSIAEARANAHGIVQGMRDKLNAEIARERADVEKLIAEKITEAETRITASKAAALSHVNEVASDTAGGIVQRLIGGRVTKADVTEAVGKALTN